MRRLEEALKLRFRLRIQFREGRKQNAHQLSDNNCSIWIDTLNPNQ